MRNDLKKMNKKKLFILVGGGIMSALLIALILGQMQPMNESKDITKEEVEEEVIGDIPDEIIISPSEDTQDSLANGEDEGTEQTIQGDVEKPKYTEEELTNPDVKPDGEEVTEEDVAIPHDSSEIPTVEPEITISPSPDTSTESSGGLPGFVHVPDAGESENVYVDGMEENGNKVGIMD